MTDLSKFYAKEFQAFENYYKSTIETLYSNDNPISEVCRYVLTGQGKRVRPLLCILTHSGFHSDFSRSLPSATALEFIHTYSLVHDDLPAMDNDDLRRGRPTAHKRFNEAYAILAGDGILADAFRILTDPTFSDADAKITVSLVQTLAKLSGTYGMVAGQTLDLHFESVDHTSTESLERIHRLKTGKLMGASMALGALSAGAPTSKAEKYQTIGEELGLVFQLVDDLLDDLPGTGKTQGKDKDAGKLTYLSFYSREKCELIAEEKTEDILERLDSLEASDKLRQLCRQLCQRNR